VVCTWAKTQTHPRFESCDKAADFSAALLFAGIAVKTLNINLLKSPLLITLANLLF
jgi:hypothetical protein